MGERAAPRVDVSIGDVENSQLVVGDHNTIQTPAGTRVTVLQVGERPVPKLRPLPISRRPSTAEILGREEELDLIAAAGAEAPVQLYAPDGSGKTSVLKLAALRVSPPAEGVVFESARHRSLDEIQAGLYRAFWECEIPFIPAPSEFEEFLADRQALLVIDDCGLDRSELETLLDSLPRCTVVLASQARTLWSRGAAQGLSELDPAAAVGLLERELGGRLDPDEREAAETVVDRLGGNPQSLVETAALVADGRSSLRELADDPAALERRFDPSALTDPQKRILELLAVLGGAALGSEHVAAVTGVGEAGAALEDLERRGWAKAGSPRYRGTRKLPPDAAGSFHREAVELLLGYLTAWSGKAKPSAVAEEAEAIERILELGAATKRWKETLALTLAAERGLIVAGAWSSGRRVLRTGLRAATEIGDASAGAYFLHQLGSQSLCLGDRAGAAQTLTDALQIREQLGEDEGAELTRHNLRQLEGGGGGEGGGEGGGGPRWPRMALAVTVLAVVAGIVAALLLAGGEDRSIAGTDTLPLTDPTTTPTDPAPPPTDTTGTPLSGMAPTITIESPGNGDIFEEGADPVASFDCVAAEDTELESCDGLLDGEPIEDGGPLDTRSGDHTLVVTATDGAGRDSSEEVVYTVEAAPPAEVDEERPQITITAPGSGKAYVLGAPVGAAYSCDDESMPVTCDGTVETGGPVDTKTVGPKQFSVTAVDAAGNENTEVVEYEVVEPNQPG